MYEIMAALEKHSERVCVSASYMWMHALGAPKGHANSHEEEDEDEEWLLLLDDEDDEELLLEDDEELEDDELSPEGTFVMYVSKCMHKRMLICVCSCVYAHKNMMVYVCTATLCASKPCVSCANLCAEVYPYVDACLCVCACVCVCVCV